MFCSRLSKSRKWRVFRRKPRSRRLRARLVHLQTSRSTSRPTTRMMWRALVRPLLPRRLQSRPLRRLRVKKMNPRSLLKLPFPRFLITKIDISCLGFKTAGEEDTVWSAPAAVAELSSTEVRSQEDDSVSGTAAFDSATTPEDEERSRTGLPRGARGERSG